MLTADCSRATSRLPFGRRAVAFRSRNAGSAPHGCWPNHACGMCRNCSATKTSEDFLRASASLCGHGGGCSAGALATRAEAAGQGCQLSPADTPPAPDPWAGYWRAFRRFRLGTSAQTPGGLYIVRAELIAVAILPAHIRIQQRRHGAAVFWPLRLVMSGLPRLGFVLLAARPSYRSNLRTCPETQRS